MTKFHVEASKVKKAELRNYLRTNATVSPKGKFKQMYPFFPDDSRVYISKEDFLPYIITKNNNFYYIKADLANGHLVLGGDGSGGVDTGVIARVRNTNESGYTIGDNYLRKTDIKQDTPYSVYLCDEKCYGGAYIIDNAGEKQRLEHRLSELKIYRDSADEEVTEFAKHLPLYLREKITEGTYWVNRYGQTCVTVYTDDSEGATIFVQMRHGKGERNSITGIKLEDFCRDYSSISDETMHEIIRMNLTRNAESYFKESNRPPQFAGDYDIAPSSDDVKHLEEEVEKLNRDNEELLDENETLEGQVEELNEIIEGLRRRIEILTKWNRHAPSIGMSWGINDPTGLRILAVTKLLRAEGSHDVSNVRSVISILEEYVKLHEEAEELRNLPE